MAFVSPLSDPPRQPFDACTINPLVDATADEFLALLRSVVDKVVKFAKLDAAEDDICIYSSAWFMDCYVSKSEFMNVWRMYNVFTAPVYSCI